MDNSHHLGSTGLDGDTRQAATRLATAILKNAGTEQAESARLLAQALPELHNPSLEEGVLEALRQSSTIPAGLPVLDSLWLTWQGNRHAGLGSLLEQQNQPASHPMDLRILSALLLNRLDVIQAAGAPAVEALLDACNDRDSLIGNQAEDALKNLTSPAARDEVCRWVLEHDNPHARQAALAAGYVPQSAQDRALFYLLTGQWDKYERLDFDANLLEAVYAAGSDTLRQQIANAARQSGWSGFVQAIAGGRARRRLTDLGDYEWEAVLLILSRAQRWPEAWQLAQSAPPVWSARLLRSLHEAGWSPGETEEKAAFERVTTLASACLELGSAAGVRIQHQAALYGHTRQITSLVLVPQHKLAATASADRSVRLWDIEQGHILKTLEGHTDFALALAVAPGGDWLVSGGADKTMRLWSLPDGTPLHTFGGHAGRVSQVAVTPDGSLITSGDDRSVYFWSANSRSMAQSLRNQFNGLTAMAITPDGGTLVTGDSDRAVKLWTLPDGELHRNLLAPLVGWTLSPDGSLLASSSSYSAMQLWRVPEGETIRNLPGRANNTLLAFSPDGRWLACADRSNVLLWDLHGEDASRTFKGGAALTSSLAFSPDSHLIAAGNQDRILRLWSIADGELLRTLEGYTTPIRHLAFTPDGHQIVSSDELSLQIWTLENLATIFNTPSGSLDPITIEGHLSNPELTERQRMWLEFSLALAHWQRRYDIEVGEIAPFIPVGDYDIEIEF